MGTEIERKFLVTGDEWRKSGNGSRYRQGYLANSKERTVRIRVADNNGYITIKGATTGATREEFEYEIPVTDAAQMLDTLCEKPLIEKTRYRISYAEQIWEVDEFFGDNAGLIVAEIELTNENQKIELPAWAGREVTGDPRYYNASLVKCPFRSWADNLK